MANIPVGKYEELVEVIPLTLNTTTVSNNYTRAFRIGNMCIIGMYASLTFVKNTIIASGLPTPDNVNSTNYYVAGQGVLSVNSNGDLVVSSQASTTPTATICSITLVYKIASA